MSFIQSCCCGHVPHIGKCEKCDCTIKRAINMTITDFQVS
jgi:hypothetical protein